MANPNNCDVITIGNRAELHAPEWMGSFWGVSGLRRRPPGQ
jgi:hypothetical protein